MATETTATSLALREDPREVGQEFARGTMDLDGTGAGSITVSLSGELEAVGLGLFAVAGAGDGTASTANLSADSVDVEISGGTADQTNVEWAVTVSEDGFFRDTGAALDGGSAP